MPSMLYASPTSWTANGPRTWSRHTANELRRRSRLSCVVWHRDSTGAKRESVTHELLRWYPKLSELLNDARNSRLVCSRMQRDQHLVLGFAGRRSGGVRTVKSNSYFPTRQLGHFFPRRTCHWNLICTFRQPGHQGCLRRHTPGFP